MKREIMNVSVIGSGSMGHQIAMLCALGGYKTNVFDKNQDALLKAEKTLEKLMNRWVEKGKINGEKKKEAFSKLTFTNNMENAVEDTDFIIEAIIEDLEAKRDLFEALERIVPSHTIMVSNSSTMVSSMIVKNAKNLDKVCNMHFFFPPLVMDCVEIAPNKQTSQNTIAKVIEVCEKIKRTHILLNEEIHGFIANRLLHALTREAFNLYEQGFASFEDIDLVCKKALAHPMGPFELADLSGNDVLYDTQKQLYKETNNPEHRPFYSLRKKVLSKELGRKTKKGWYDYT